MNGEYPRTEEPFNHAFLLWLLPKFYAYDNYVDQVDGDFIKKLAPNYRFFEFGYRVYISAEITPEEREIGLIAYSVLEKYNLLAYFADWWDSFIRRMRGFLGL